ncbi:MAG: hypothetical protein WBA13_15335 [Microcoleaceae cyanobacterium]
MILAEISSSLIDQFGEIVVQPEPNIWQVEDEKFRLLILLSDDHTWLRILIPIAPLQEAESILTQLLEANFDITQSTRYAIHQNVVWGVFQYSFTALTETEFLAAIATLITLHEQGFSNFFSQLIEDRIRQVILMSKRQGQSIETTMQTLERFYAEGLMGEMQGSSTTREQTLEAWRQQLERLWPEVE